MQAGSANITCLYVEVQEATMKNDESNLNANNQETREGKARIGEHEEAVKEEGRSTANNQSSTHRFCLDQTKKKREQQEHKTREGTEDAEAGGRGVRTFRVICVVVVVAVVGSPLSL